MSAGHTYNDVAGIEINQIIQTTQYMHNIVTAWGAHADLMEWSAFSRILFGLSNYNRANDVAMCACVWQPTPKTADVNRHQNRRLYSCPHSHEPGIFFRIFGIHSFYATATLLNIWICM